MLKSKLNRVTYATALFVAILPLEGNSQEMIRIDGVTLYDSFFGFNAEEITEYPEPELGFSIPYRRDDAILTAYIYDNGLEPFPDFVTDEAALAHFDQITNDVFAAQSQELYQDVQIISRFSLDDNMGRVDWLCSMFELRFPSWESPGNSISCLAVSGWNFLKIRMSSNAMSQEAFEELSLRVTAIFAHSAGL